jgi:hypothetical protein
MASGSSERFAAKFDALHTIRIPGEDLARRRFLSEHRRFRLNVDFKRDLHQRLFRAFASLGFDDDKWWSDEDLKFLVAKGQALQRFQEAAVEAAKADLPKLQMAASDRKGGNKAKDLVTQAEKEAARTEKLLRPLLVEYENRFGRPPDPGIEPPDSASGSE